MLKVVNVKAMAVDRRNGLHSKGHFFSLWTGCRINSQPTQYVPC